MIGIITCILLLTISNGVLAQPRQRLLMDLNWKFSQTDTIGAEKTAFDDSGWRSLKIPHDWSIENAFIEEAPTTGRGGYLPTGIGWYRRHFSLPKAWLGKQISVEFDGVYQNSDVWINGHHLGHYPNGYLSFYYDLTPHVKAGENVLTVRVNNSRQPNSRWYSGSGIYRNVWLIVTEPLHVAHWGTYITTPSVDSLKCSVVAKTRVQNDHERSMNFTLRQTIFDPSGRQVAGNDVDLTLEAGAEAEQLQRLSIDSPELWSLESPMLYTIKTELIVRRKVVDMYITTFGVREIQYDVDKGFLLNGKHVKMNGVCLHHDGGSVGAAVPIAVWKRRLSVLKEMGCNAIRTAHNPVAPEFLDLCDQMGFLVQDEVFDEWTYGKVRYGYSNYFKEWAQHDLLNFIRRDRNHPSVVMWSAGNEIGEQSKEGGHEILRPLIDMFHREDPTRPVTTGNDHIAADGGTATLEFLNMLDIVGYNYVDRWHERRELFHSVDRHDHPDWKMVGTESVSIPGIRGNYFGGRWFSVDSTSIRPAYMPGVIRAEQLWKFVSSRDYVIGDFMWTGIDYLGEARWPSKNASSGVIDLCGFPKDGYYFYQSQWTEDPMIHMFPHWNWKGQEGQVIPVMVYTNCDTVELFVNDKSYGMKSLEFPRQGNSGAWNRYDKPVVAVTTGDLHLMWDVPYSPGVLKAVGRKDGKIAFEKEVYTTGTPSAIRLSVDKKVIMADMIDMAHLKIEIVDSDGRIVPDANQRITVNVSGTGSLIGLDNGNPVDHSSMKSNSRSTFNGLAMAVIQSTLQPGKVIVKCEGTGLRGMSIEISSNKPSATTQRIK